MDFLFCFSPPLSPLQLSERARERKVPVTRIGRLANFGGESALPHLPWPWHMLVNGWLGQGSCSAALGGSICHFSLLIGNCFPTNSLVSSELDLSFFIARKSLGQVIWECIVELYIFMVAHTMWAVLF